jgi:hypothetical protein
MVAGGEVWRKGPTGMSEVENELDQQGDSKHASEEGKVGQSQPFLGPIGQSYFLVWDCLHSFRSWMKGFHAWLREAISHDNLLLD